MIIYTQSYIRGSKKKVLRVKDYEEAVDCEQCDLAATKGGGGAGVSTVFGEGAVGGSNAVGTNCSVSYGGGGGGEATFAGGNGCPVFITIGWWN